MIDILQYLPPRTRKSPSGWFSFNAPCCIHNGETPDKKKRGGIILDGDDWAYHCFNCNYKARFIYGQQLSLKARNLLKWLGVPHDTIQKINLESLRNNRDNGEQKRIKIENLKDTLRKLLSEEIKFENL